MKHAMQIDCEGRVSRPVGERYVPKTYKQVIVGEVEKRVELIEDPCEPSPFAYTDFSLGSIIASGNLDLLNPVGTISDTALTSREKIEGAVEGIGFMESQIPVEPLNPVE